MTEQCFLPLTPRIANTKYSDFDVPVIMIDAVEDEGYGADPTGTLDSTAAIQKALDAAAEALGGTVYLPEGKYRLTATVQIPKSVTLRGDWKRPIDDEPAVVRGTVLLIEHGQGTTGVSKLSGGEGASVGFLLHDQAGLRDLSIYYPQQTLEGGQVIPFPFTIDSVGSFPTVRNVSLVNSYDGMYFGVHKQGSSATTKTGEGDGDDNEDIDKENEGNEGDNEFGGGGSGSVSFPNAITIYGCPLHCGWVTDRTAATPRYEGISLGPRYWVESGLHNIGTPLDEEMVVEAMRSVHAVGFKVGKGCGGGVFMALRLRGYEIGIQSFGGPQSPRFLDVDISQCNIGISVGQTKNHGWVLTKGSIIAESVAIEIKDGARHVAFNNFRLRSGGNAVVHHRAGVLTMTQCVFESWSEDVFAIDSQHVGSDKETFLSVTGCTFHQAQKHISIGSNVVRGVIFGNSCTTSENECCSIDVENHSRADKSLMVIDTKQQHDFAKMDPTEFMGNWLAVQKQVPRPNPGTSHIFNVADFGASTTDPGTKDSTLAFQKALEQAGKVANKVAGCIVFVPTGVYRINGVLRIPSHVEMRGVHDGGFKGSPRSILCLFQDAENGTPASIEMDADSGIRGLVFYRPDQVWDGRGNKENTLTQLPWAIKGTNRNWAYDSLLANIYDGIDFSMGGGHSLEFVVGCSLHQMIKLGSSKELSTAYNIQCKDQFWRTMGDRHNQDFPLYLESGFGRGAPDNVAKSHGLAKIGTGIVLEGNGQFRTLAHFINRSGAGLCYVNGSPKANMYLCGGEGPGTGIYITSNPETPMDIEVVSNSYHTWGEAYTVSTTNPGDRLRIINCKNFGGAPRSHIFKGGGHLVVQQEYRGKRHDVTYQLEGDATTVLEGGFLEANAADYRILARDNSQVKCVAAWQPCQSGESKRMIMPRFPWKATALL